MPQAELWFLHLFIVSGVDVFMNNDHCGRPLFIGQCNRGRVTVLKAIMAV